MYYGLSSQDEAVRVARLICGALGNGSNNTAVKLLVETAQQETKLGAYRDPSPYAAGFGLCQFDEIAFEDVKHRTRSKTALKVYNTFGIDLKKVQHREMELSPMLSMVFCRLFYRLIPDPIPKDLQGRALYWKKYYNTMKGKGTSSQYIHSANKIEVKY